MVGRIILAIIFAILGGLNVVTGNSIEQRPLQELKAYRLNTPLKLDGYLSEGLYQNTPWSNFIQVDPDNGQPASQKTEVWVGYDDHALYVGAHLWDNEPDSIIARYERRDESDESDFFMVGIDSYLDRRTAFLFGVNPVGSIMDGTFRNDSWSDMSWDGVWFVSTRQDSTGWYLEMKIPYSQLRFNRENDGEYVWGVGFIRQIYRRREISANFYIPRGESGVVSRFPQLTGIRDIRPPRRFEALPYITGKYANLPSRADNPFFKGRDSKFNTGLDLKLGIGSNITIDATINPDFGQVEVDPSVINLTAYETYYEEKRPFFIEGASIFSFGEGGPTSNWNFNYREPSFFYSRRIGRQPQGSVSSEGYVDFPEATTILGAAKISGKLRGNWSLGAITAFTNQEFARINNEGHVTREKIEPLTSYNLVRLHKEFSEGTRGLGFISTYVHRFFEPGGDENLRSILSSNSRALGLDGWYFLGKERKYVLAGWLGYSRVEGSQERILNLQTDPRHYFQRPDQTHVKVDSTLKTLSGYAGQLVFNKEKGHVILYYKLAFISPGFETNDIGLTYRTDMINQSIVTGYRWYDPGKIFRNVTLSTAYTRGSNFGGYKTSEIYFTSSSFQFLNYWGFYYSFGLWPETLSDSKLRGGPMVLTPPGYFLNTGVYSDFRKDYSFSTNYSQSESKDGSNSRSYFLSFNLKPSSRFSISLRPSFSLDYDRSQYITSVTDPDANHTLGKRYIFASINRKTLSMDIRWNWSLTPSISLQCYVQPFIAMGKYSEFKEYSHYRESDYMLYGKEEGTSVEFEDGKYILDPDTEKQDDEIEIQNPDFNYKALVGNLVLRWEFLPGSTLYLVWTRNGYDFSNPGHLNFARDVNDLFRAISDDVFAIKFSYWIG